MARDLYSRRQILAGGVGAALAYGMSKSASAYLGVHGHETIRRATEMSGGPQDLGAIEHVIFLMHENRSFDHYFGTLGGVRRLQRPLVPAFAQAWPGEPSSTLLPFHLNPNTEHAECTYDLSHAWQAEHDSWNNGTMDRFVSTHTSTAFEGPNDGMMTMGYYEKRRHTLLLRAGQEVHHLRRLLLFGPRSDAPQPAAPDVGDPRPRRRGRRPHPRHQQQQGAGVHDVVDRPCPRS